MSLEDTEPRHDESHRRFFDHLLPSDPSIDPEYCLKCLGLIEVKVKRSFTSKYDWHETIEEVEQYAKRCLLCHYIYWSFGPAVREKAKVLLSDGRKLRFHVSVGTLTEERQLVPFTVTWMVTFGEGWGKFMIRKEFLVVNLRARGATRAIWSRPTTLDFEARAPVISEWLEECLNHHPECHCTPDPTKPRASRILEVLDNAGTPTLRLVSATNVDLHKNSYVVLTHCWGGIEITAKTTLANIHTYYNTIEFDALPKTFRECIEIVRALGLQYLWIDSLCIIQDDNADFEVEAAKMASIFHGATLTISATSAEDSSQGCGISIPLLPAAQFYTEGARDDRQPRKYFAIRDNTRDSQREMRDLYCDSLIHTRAWTFQEKILSHRILHATHSQFIFQCCTLYETEDGLAVSRRSALGAGPLEVHVPTHWKRSLTESHDMREKWWIWAQDYKQREVSKESDMYAAFAGVTELYQELMGDEPIVGLWKRDIGIHLGWHADNKEPNPMAMIKREAKFTPAKMVRDRRPTWTWMSFPQGSVKPWLMSVNWPEMAPLDGRTSSLCYQAKLISHSVQWTGDPLVSSPIDCMLTLRGLYLRRQRPKEIPDWYFGLDPDIGPFRTDVKEFDVFALRAERVQPALINRPLRLVTTYLVIEPVDLGANVYRRIGTIDVGKDADVSRPVTDYFEGTYQEIRLI